MRFIVYKCRQRYETNDKLTTIILDDIRLSPGPKTEKSIFFPLVLLPPVIMLEASRSAASCSVSIDHSLLSVSADN